MKPRWLYFLIFVVLGLALLGCGLLVPAHLRALDTGVLQMARKDSPALVEQGNLLAAEKKLGAAKLLAQAAETENIHGAAQLAAATADLSRQNPDAAFWGDDSRAENVFGRSFQPSDEKLTLTAFVVRQDNRNAALANLQNSSVQAVQELLRSRSLKNTVLLPAASSASGQAFDTAVCICGLLLDENRLSANLNAQILSFAVNANGGASSQPLEQTLMDFLSLGQRLNWDQLTAFVANVPDADTLHQLADEARNAGDNLPVLFAAVQLSGRPAAVANYLAEFPDTGFQDLGAGLRYGAGGVGELAQSGKRFYNSAFERRLTDYNPFGAIYYFGAGVAVQNPWLALAAKWFLYLLAGFFLAVALHFAVPPIQRPLQVRGFHLAREFLFSLGFLLVVVLLSEPFLAQESQKGNFSLRLFPSTVGGAIPAGIAGLKQTIMNPTIIITLLVFFVLQALLYISCLVKLAEIRRQNIPPRMKLKLLENEDHLFDAGLYLGFVGTIVSLILASLHFVQFSLMAAYSSTSFGIIFVVIFKIFHLRPLRRQLLLEAESQAINELNRRAVTPGVPTPALP